jgi:putative membrane protein
MLIFVLLALIILLLAVIFALQNTVAVTISFLFWQFHGSLALVLLVALAAGLVISFLAYLPYLIRGNLSARKLHKHVAELESELSDHKRRMEEALVKVQSQSEPPQTQAAAPPPPDQPASSS